MNADLRDPNFWQTEQGNVARPLMIQDWDELSFLHWSFEPEVVQRLLPSQLRVETFEGRAWVGWVPFIIRNNRFFSLPALPYLSGFTETNLRTYVRGPDQSSGVWFFSLDAAKLFAVLGARFAYGMRYFWSRMELDRSEHTFRYRTHARRFTPTACSHVAVDVGEPYAPEEVSELMQFLVFRYRLFTLWLGRLRCADVQHLPYKLHRARVLNWDESLFEAAGLPKPTEEPLVHYCPGVTARISWLRSVG